MLSDYQSQSSLSIYNILNDDHFDSPLINEEHLRIVMSQSQRQEGTLMHEGLEKDMKSEKHKSSIKIQKTKKIRSNRNSHKIYHNILKHWLEQNNCGAIINKYSQYFNKRVYFTLVLQEISKQTEGERFCQIYKLQALNVIDRKEKQIGLLKRETENCQQIEHLKRVIQQIEYSIESCNQFMEGNVLESLIIVYKRNQKKITKQKEFKEAHEIYKQWTGRYPQNL